MILNKSLEEVEEYIQTIAEMGPIYYSRVIKEIAQKLGNNIESLFNSGKNIYLTTFSLLNLLYRGISHYNFDI